jgi:hypothetical protein
MLIGTLESAESLHIAPFVQGALAHSLTSMSQIPPTATAHSAANSSINEYSQLPLAKPSTHAQLNESNGTSILPMMSEVESEHAAPFVQGELAHSSTSTSQLSLE